MRQLSSQLEQHMTSAGYELYDTPIIQPTDLFLTRAGDQIVKRLFTFERDGKSFALRPEFTASAAYSYAQLYPDQPEVVRWQFDGFVFIDFPSGAQQRRTIGAELFGLNDASADAEIIGLAVTGLDAVGLKAWHIDIGHVGLLRALLNHFNLDSRTQRFILHHLAALSNPAQGKGYVMEQLDRLLQTPAEMIDLGAPTPADVQRTLDAVLESGHFGVTMGGRDRSDIARRLIQKRQRFAERHQVSAALDLLEHVGSVRSAPSAAFAELVRLGGSDPTASRILARWQDVIGELQKSGVAPERIAICPALARDWEYYTGIVFELRAGDDRHLGGGGRYDELVRLVGGRHDTPAVGFVYYADALMEALA
jgi:ATP phosphoribosyltransferase regulatory subunit HisZ